MLEGPLPAFLSQKKKIKEIKLEKNKKHSIAI